LPNEWWLNQTTSATVPWINNTTAGTATTWSVAPTWQPQLQQLTSFMTAGNTGSMPDSPAQRQAQEEGLRAAREESEQARLQARRLLAACLSRDQRRELHAAGAFHVVGSEGRRYLIHRGQVRNVLELDDKGRPRARWCGHPDPRVEPTPDEDAMLAQKLLIETDEARFRDVANLVATGVGAAA
jgi:hypothetical protein